MRKIDFSLETVTPTFVGGASFGAEWRAPSVRGQLRFWFRAIAGGDFAGDVDRVRQAERALFGSTDQASLLVVRTQGAPPPVTIPIGRRLGAAEIAAAWGERDVVATESRLRLMAGGKERPSNPAQYLGYGPFDKDGVKEGRSYFPERSPLHLALLMRTTTPGVELLERALWAWLNLGGIGSRSRRGFGSLCCTAVSDAGLQPRMRVGSVEELSANLEWALGSPGGALPPWTAASAHARVFVSESTCATAADALTLGGSWLVAFRRRYGRSGDTRAGIAPDYHWAKDPSSAGAGLPDRAGFGLPLNFGKETQVAKAARSGREGPGKVEPMRRASPLFVHVGRFDDGFRVVFTHLPAQFLPAGQQLQLRSTRRSSTAPSGETPGMESVIRRFLEDLKAKKLVRKVWQAPV